MLVTGWLVVLLLLLRLVWRMAIAVVGGIFVRLESAMWLMRSRMLMMVTVVKLMMVRAVGCCVVRSTMMMVNDVGNQA